MSIKSKGTVDFKIYLELTEQEASALHAITVYGSKSFLEYFYKNLGKSYLQPHEKGLVSLFEIIRQELPSHLDKAKKAREVFKS